MAEELAEAVFTNTQDGDHFYDTVGVFSVKGKLFLSLIEVQVSNN